MAVNTVCLPLLNWSCFTAKLFIHPDGGEEVVELLSGGSPHAGHTRLTARVCKMCFKCGLVPEHQHK